MPCGGCGWLLRLPGDVGEVVLSQHHCRVPTSTSPCGRADGPLSSGWCSCPRLLSPCASASWQGRSVPRLQVAPPSPPGQLLLAAGLLL